MGRRMLKFKVFDAAPGAEAFSLRHAYLLGSDQNAIRASITFEDGLIVCEKREPGVAALVLQYTVKECGYLMMQTCVLQDRSGPYLLSLELARYRMHLLYTKLEDWLMFELNHRPGLLKRLELSRRTFIKALCHQDKDPARCDRLAKRCMAIAVDAGEAISLAHAELFLEKRITSGSMPPCPVGCGMMLEQQIERVRAGLLANIDYFYLPIPWRNLAPQEGEYQWEPLDRWLGWLTQHQTQVIAGPLVSFGPHHVPDWLYIWEHDYKTLRDLVYDHTEQVVARSRGVIGTWNAVSGLHVKNHFNFNFEQLMELSRMTTMLVKKIQPASKVLIEICQPFGEYYATNHRSIPPRMYADLLLQSSIHFDGFVLKLLMGQPMPGQSTRDLMQVSHLLDKYAGFGKPVTVVVAVPSASPPSAAPRTPKHSGQSLRDEGGYWRKPWSPRVQSRWLEAVFKIAMSKPFIDAVAWYEWRDRPGMELPMAGLVTSDRQPKEAFRTMVRLRKRMLGLGSKQRPDASSQQAPPGGHGPASVLDLHDT